YPSRFRSVRTCAEPAWMHAFRSGKSRNTRQGGQAMTDQPTFAFVTIGSGSYVGSTVRDLILANALHRRGFKVAVYWMMECKPELAADGIRQRMLCYAPRYHCRRPSEILDRVIAPLLFLFPLHARVRVSQGIPGYADRLLENLTRCLHETPETDPVLV